MTGVLEYNRQKLMGIALREQGRSVTGLCWFLEHMAVNTVRLPASQFNQINRPIFSDLKLYAAVKLR